MPHYGRNTAKALSTQALNAFCSRKDLWDRLYVPTVGHIVCPIFGLLQRNKHSKQSQHVQNAQSVGPSGYRFDDKAWPLVHVGADGSIQTIASISFAPRRGHQCNSFEFFSHFHVVRYFRIEWRLPLPHSSAPSGRIPCGCFLFSQELRVAPARTDEMKG